MEENKTILIVDDSVITRKKITQMLAKTKFNIIEAVSGRDAISKVSNLHIDCILLDLLMPEANGFDVLKYFKQNKIKIPVIVLSADIQETTREMVFELGAADFLYKPPKENDLIDAIFKTINIIRDGV